MNKKLIRLTESDLHSIINDAVKSIISEGYFKQPKRKTLKTVKANDVIITAFFEEGDESMWVEWNREDASITRMRTQWLTHVKGNIYSTYTNWDELDFALKALGVKKVGQKSHISDWGDDDKDTFTNSFYDFSSCLD